MSKLYFLSSVLVVFLLVGCNQIDKKRKGENVTIQNKKTIKERGIAYIENNLKINAAEKYEMEYFEAFIDQDTIKDALFLVRRKEYATLKAKKAKVYDNFIKLGSTANENYIYVYNGKTKKFRTTAPIGSSMNQPIQVDFKSITSLSKKDIVINYYILDSKFVSYYTVNERNVYPVLNHPIYTDYGKETQAAYSVKFSEGTFSLAKDIDLYKSELFIKDSIEQFFPSEELYLKFMFDPRKQKYVTKGVE
ncbi:MAG: hypothetical protein ACPGU5_08695 [Lishizhenia sp.]